MLKKHLTTKGRKVLHKGTRRERVNVNYLLIRIPIYF